MSNLLVASAGGVASGVDVPHEGARVHVPNPRQTLVVVANASAHTVYLNFADSVDGECTAVVGAGIPLGPGAGYELNSANMVFAEIWAVHDGGPGQVARVCVLACR